MKKGKKQTCLHTKTKSFHGVEFKIVDKVDGKPVKMVSKTVNLLSALKIYKFLKSHLHDASYVAETLGYYLNYADDIERILDECEKNFTKGDSRKTKYYIGGNYAIFLDTNKNGGEVVWADNHEAARIIKQEYKKVYPDNKIVFDPELSHCYVYAETREEAKRFMTWMNETYFQPWVKENLDGWDDFIKAYKEATREEQVEFMTFHIR